MCRLVAITYGLKIVSWRSGGYVSGPRAKLLIGLVIAAVVAGAIVGVVAVRSNDSASSVMLGGVDDCVALQAVPCYDQAAQVDVPIDGTDLHLVYRSNRVPGRTAAPTADVTSLGLGGWTLNAAGMLDGSVLL